VSSLSFDTLTFKPAKITGIVVITKELAKLSDPSASDLIQKDLAAATSQFMDAAFLDPSIAEVADISPASITFGAPTVASTGATASAVSADLSNLLGQITTNFTSMYLVMRRSTALGLAKLKSTGGSDAFPQLGVNGGSIWGISVLISDSMSVGTDSPGNHLIVAIDASEVFFNDGGIELDASENALLEMQTSPDSPRTGSTLLVSLWQQNLVGVLVRRYVRWLRRHDGCCAVLTGVPF
jgi:HK97 family phage major capsid protein